MAASTMAIGGIQQTASRALCSSSVAKEKGSQQASRVEMALKREPAAVHQRRRQDISVTSMLHAASSSTAHQGQWWEQLFHFPADPWKGILPDLEEAEAQPERASALPAMASRSAKDAPAASPLLVKAAAVPRRKSIASEDWRAVRFTSQKARTLRSTLKDSESWLDHMYHSATASRLAESDM